MHFSTITITEVTCFDYRQQCRCLQPLTICIHDDQNETLSRVFEQIFSKIYLFLSEHGYQTCEFLDSRISCKFDARFKITNNSQQESLQYYAEYNYTRGTMFKKSKYEDPYLYTCITECG